MYREYTIWYGMAEKESSRHHLIYKARSLCTYRGIFHLQLVAYQWWHTRKTTRRTRILYHDYCFRDISWRKPESQKLVRG